MSCRVRPARLPAARSKGVIELKEMRILSTCGLLGYGFPDASFNKGLERNPDVIAVDAGSTDAGPQTDAGFPDTGCAPFAVPSDPAIVLRLSVPHSIDRSVLIARNLGLEPRCVGDEQVDDTRVK